MKKDKKVATKVVDITGKMDDYVTLEKFMKKTEYKFSCDFKMAGNGFVSSDRVRVYHRILGRLAPAPHPKAPRTSLRWPLLYAIRKMVRMRLRVEGIKVSGIVVLPFMNLLILLAATATKFTCQGFSIKAYPLASVSRKIVTP